MGRRVRGGRCAQEIAYVPLPSQERFHRSRVRFKGFSGPVGSGKSQALCQEAIRLSYVNAGRLALVGAPTYPMLRDATQNALLEILDANEIPHDLNKAENMLVFKDTGSRILFRAVEDFERLRGTNLAWFGVDELTYCPEDAWLRLEARLRDPRARELAGFGVWSPKGFDWVYRKFIAAQVDGYEAILARPFGNRFLLDKVPDFYQRLEKSYDARFYRQEVLGEYLSVSADRVYHAFERGVQIHPLQVNERRPLLWALDFNVDPMSSVVAQMDGGAVQVLDEIVISRASTRDACVEFHQRYPRHPGELVIYGDASGNAMKTTGNSDYQIIREFFRSVDHTNVHYRVPKDNPAVRERVMLMNAKLRNAAGDVELRVDPKCKELIKDFEKVSYKAGTTLIDKDRDPKRTHLSDALGYLLWQECRPRLTIGERDDPLVM